jgi:predicted transcriptional regulator
MPITREQFNNSVGRFGKNDNYVLSFLKKNKNNAYTVVELAKIFRKNESTIIGHLKKLMNKGLVERKSPHYILNLKKFPVRPFRKRIKR